MILDVLKSTDYRRLVAPLPAILVMLSFFAGPHFSDPDEGGKNQQLLSYEEPAQFLSNPDSEISHSADTAGENEPSGIPTSWWGNASSVVKPDNSRRHLLKVNNGQAVKSSRQYSLQAQPSLATLASVSNKLCKQHTMLGLKPSGTS